MDVVAAHVSIASDPNTPQAVSNKRESHTLHSHLKIHIREVSSVYACYMNLSPVLFKSPISRSLTTSCMSNILETVISSCSIDDKSYTKQHFLGSVEEEE